MEVVQSRFYGILKDLLIDIADSEFVSIDFEFSGIARSQFKRREPQGRGPPDIQARYLETREAAQRYLIIQFGLTVATKDAKSGMKEIKLSICNS
jgi:poly(A)-specific ribonuclease